MKKIGITLSSCPGLGDKLVFTSFPENFFAATGLRLIDVDKSWCFDSNPFVVQDQDPEVVFDPRLAPIPSFHRSWSSIAERTMVQFGLDPKALVLRHPRLYRFENTEKTKRLVVHTQGITRQATLSPAVVSHILKKYFDWEIIQVGATSDPTFPNSKDFRGAPIWRSVELIAQSSIFIGVDSGPSWIAACYPNIQCKVVLSGFSSEFIFNMDPMSCRNNEWHWYKCNRQYFNETESDLNITLSYNKI